MFSSPPPGLGWVDQVVPDWIKIQSFVSLPLSTLTSQQSVSSCTLFTSLANSKKYIRAHKTGWGCSWFRENVPGKQNKIWVVLKFKTNLIHWFAPPRMNLHHYLFNHHWFFPFWLLVRATYHLMLMRNHTNRWWRPIWVDRRWMTTCCCSWHITCIPTGWRWWREHRHSYVSNQSVVWIDGWMDGTVMRMAQAGTHAKQQPYAERKQKENKNTAKSVL